MRTVLVIILLALLVPGHLVAGQDYLEVTAPGNRLLTLAIAPPVLTGGSQNDAAASELAELFRFDMALAGPFTVKGAPAVAGKSGLQPGTFDFAP